MKRFGKFLTFGAVTGAVYLALILPRIRRKPDREKFKKWYYAHRGLHDNRSDAPENSLAAFAKAVEAGYGIELDVQLSKDGIPVVFHDYTLDRVCGVKGKVCDHTFEELRQFRLCGTDERIPKFEEVLDLVAGRVPLIVELKIERFDTSVCPAADKLLRKYKGDYCIESFNPLGLFWYRRHRADVMRGQLADVFLRESKEYRTPLHFCLQNLFLNALGRPDFIAYHNKYPKTLSRRICCGPMKAMGAAWTIKSAEELERAREHFDLFIFEGFLPNPAGCAAGVGRARPRTNSLDQ